MALTGRSAGGTGLPCAPLGSGLGSARHILRFPAGDGGDGGVAVPAKHALSATCSLMPAGDASRIRLRARNRQAFGTIASIGTCFTVRSVRGRPHPGDFGIDRIFDTFDTFGIFHVERHPRQQNAPWRHELDVELAKEAPEQLRGVLEGQP